VPGISPNIGGGQFKVCPFFRDVNIESMLILFFKIIKKSVCDGRIRKDLEYLIRVLRVIVSINLLF
jgi:hypothetical protein